MRIKELLEKMYKGTHSGHYDPAKDGHVSWWTTDKWLAQQYGGGTAFGDKHLTIKDIPDDVVNKTFHHNFKTDLDNVSPATFGDQVKRGIAEALKKGWINKETAKDLVDEVDIVVSRSGRRPEPVWKYWYQNSDFTDILKKAGFVSIYNKESGSDSYGILK